MSIQDINPKDIYSYIFILSPNNRLVTYKYYKGLPNNIASTNPAFFQELIEYLQKNTLVSILRLQTLYEGLLKQIIEIILKDISTIILDILEVKYRDIYRVTGQYIGQKDKIIDFNKGESYTKTTKGTH